MKKYISSIFLSSILLALSACNSNEEINEVQQGTPLTISTQIQSRGVIESENFGTGDHIGVFVYNSDNTGNYSDDFINVDVAYAGGNWELSKNLYLAQESCNIYGYYPYSNGNTLNNVKIDLTPDAEKGQTDYLYSIDNECVSMDNPNALLNFRHALARVSFSFKLAEVKENTEYILSAATLRNVGESTNIAVKGTMNIFASGSIEPEANHSAAISLSNMNKPLSTTETQTVDFLVIPTNIQNDNSVELEVVINYNRYVLKLPANYWAAGVQYTYPITINISDEESEENTSSALAKVGDYYYSDGTWSSEYDDSKTCIGIVFALSKEQDGDIDVSLEESMHGRIVALQDLEKKYAWGSNGIDVEGISNYNYPAGIFYTEYGSHWEPYYLPLDGESQYYYSDYPKQNISANYTTWLTSYGYDWALTDYNGKQHTSFISDFDFPAANACYYKTMGEIASGFWYLPSCGEMGRLAMACAIGIVSQTNQPIFKNLMVGDLAAGEVFEGYWTSTEKSSNAVFYYEVATGRMGGEVKAAQINVRPIASF